VAEGPTENCRAYEDSYGYYAIAEEQETWLNMGRHKFDESKMHGSKGERMGKKLEAM
jgi:hypothetical protein